MLVKESPFTTPPSHVSSSPQISSMQPSRGAPFIDRADDPRPPYYFLNSPTMTHQSVSLAANQKRSQSHNQVIGLPLEQTNEVPTLTITTKLTPLRLDGVPPPVNLESTSLASVSLRDHHVETLRRTRRGSVILNATIKATSTVSSVSGDVATPDLGVLSPSRRRMKSNQDDEDNGPAKPTLQLDVVSPRSNQREEPLITPDTPRAMPAPPPPQYFRLQTFCLDDDQDGTRSPTVGTPSPRRNATPSKPAQIDGIFREIWQTEESYVAALRGLVTQFFEPLQTFAKQNQIDLGAMGGLHHSTTTILSIHEELIRQLEPLHLHTCHGAISSPKLCGDPFGEGFTGTLARIHQLSKGFLSTIEYMKVYAFYCGSYLSAKQELEILQRQYPSLGVFTTELNERALRGHGEGDAHTALDINSNLIKPVQRICRYPLLFKSLLSNATSPEETLVLQQTLQKIEAVSNYVNEKVRESQNNARLYQLHQMLHPSSNLELLQPSRTLLHESWADVTSLDAPRWPAKLLNHFRRRSRSRRRRSSTLAHLQLPQSREHWLRSSLFGDDRRTSATMSANMMRSHVSNGAVGTTGATIGSDRHTSFSQPSQHPHITAESTRLLRRRSTSGERSRLILLSDMLLMAKLREQHLKIRRQICLSCAMIHDDEVTKAVNEEWMTGEQGFSPPISAAVAAAAVVSGCDRSAHSFTLEVSKVGRCSCHHFSPVTLKRSPKLGSLSAFLTGRRGSISFSSSTGDLLQALHQEHPSQVGGLVRSSSQTRCSSRTSKTSSRFRYLEQLAGIGAVKRYRVTCDSAQAKADFLRAFRTAIDRSARLLSPNSQERSQPRSTSTSAKAIAIAVSLPTKIWRSLRSASEMSRSSNSRDSVGGNADSHAHSVSATLHQPRGSQSTPGSEHSRFNREGDVDLLELDSCVDEPSTSHPKSEEAMLV